PRDPGDPRREFRERRQHALREEAHHHGGEERGRRKPVPLPHDSRLPRPLRPEGARRAAQAGGARRGHGGHPPRAASPPSPRAPTVSPRPRRRPPRCASATTTSTARTWKSSTRTTRTTRTRTTGDTRRIENVPPKSEIRNPKSEISGVRIQKILAQAGMASRREAEEWIREGRVFVNGKAAKLGDRADPEKDSIRVGDKRVPARPSRRTYILLNKPKGYVTTVWDPERRDTVLDLLPGGLRRGMKPVGRLDVQTEGLLLLTDDGDLAR